MSKLRNGKTISSKSLSRDLSSIHHSNNSRKSLLANERGQGLMEYLILVALITVACVGVVRVVGNNVAKQYANVNVALGAEGPEQHDLSKVDDRWLKKKDLSNFVNGARSEND